MDLEMPEVTPEMAVNPEMADPATLIFSQQGADGPYEAYRQLHEGCPVVRSEFAGTPAVYLSRYDDVLWALVNTNEFIFNH